MQRGESLSAESDSRGGIARNLCVAGTTSYGGGHGQAAGLDVALSSDGESFGTLSLVG